MRRGFLIFYSVLAIPLDPSGNWIPGQFSSKPQNHVEQTAKGLSISVKQSASPLYYLFPRPVSVTQLSVRGRLTGVPNLGAHKEGEGAGDDYALRVGLVSPGPRPSWWRTPFLPKWIKELLAINGEQGFSQVHFFNVAQTQPAGSTRRHPKMGLVHETIAFTGAKTGDFAFERTVNPPEKVFAIWIQSDGDDTGSDFSVLIESLKLDTD